LFQKLLSRQVTKIDPDRLVNLEQVRRGSAIFETRGCSMATSILHSQNFRFQITIYLEGNWDFFLA
jgi:hypothetical protein